MEWNAKMGFITVMSRQRATKLKGRIHALVKQVGLEMDLIAKVAK
jgi:hypothetical protein